MDQQKLFRKDTTGTQPLAYRIRPETLDEFAGQEHFIGEGKLLRRLLESGKLTSAIFYGPPGTGKTTLARIIGNVFEAKFVSINATASGVKDLKAIIAEAVELLEMDTRRTVLFVDEIHRFNKAQQDVLLPEVEAGHVILIGATTENPFFTINKALVSRSHIFEFKPLAYKDVITLLRRALEDKKKGLGKVDVEVENQALEFIAEVTDGDARRALSALEVGMLSCPVGGTMTKKVAEESLQKKAVVYDKKGDGHYDTISAFIKSIRGSDPDAGLYWLAKMIEAGEDPLFIARRLVILASEDVGNASPQALPLAVSAYQATHFVGMPEARIILAQAVTFLASAPKSNASYMGIDQALSDVKHGRVQEVPIHLRGSGYKRGKQLGHGVGYDYSHSHEGHWAPQDYVAVDKVYYEPTREGFEARIKERIDKLRQLKEQAKQAAEKDKEK